MKKLKRNAVKCLRCDTVIESKHGHDFKWCKCASVFVDGGLNYIRRGWSEGAQFEDLTEYEEEPNGEGEKVEAGTD